ncbi:MAG: hypothetical protein WA884_16815 [Methyloceanibacter sp.]
MGAFRAFLAVVGAGLCAGACQAPKATLERAIMGDPGKPYVGMSKEEIIACAGAPYSSYAQSTGETLTYHYSGAGPVPAPPEQKKQDNSGGANPLAPKKSDKNYDCTASLVFEGGRLVRASFAPRGVISPYTEKKDSKTGELLPVQLPEPCTFSLPNCARR